MSDTAFAQGFPTDDSRWAALMDSKDNGVPRPFFYGVKSTGIYCRPNCASRKPKRENVAFFDSPDAAERAGFRACKRCKPDLADPESRDWERVTQACKRMALAETAPSLDELAQEAGLSPWHFQKLFKAKLGITPKQFAKQQQAERFKSALGEDGSVTAAIYQAGFGSSSRAYEGGDSQLGMPPSAFKKGGAGQEIAYGTARCFLGWVVVARTERGICAIEFGDSPEALTESLKRRFPQAKLTSAGEDFAAALEKVIAFLDRPAAGLDVPLDIQGTAFQQQVWQALRQIPAGQTASYKQVAQAMGRPKAARAVAQACAANPIAVAIPCHRVVRGDGDLSGYRWGPERKRQLLAKEAAGTSGSPKGRRGRGEA